LLDNWVQRGEIPPCPPPSRAR